MTKVRVAAFSISLDGFGAGPDQSLDDPLGRRGPELHEWFFPTDVFQTMVGAPGGTTGLDNDYAIRGRDGYGAFVIGRNMFGPIRGPWPDEQWKGWWGDNPPYHASVFVVTHHAREPLVMEGGTTFHFVDGAEEALRQAKAAAGGHDVKIGGGVSVVRQLLEKQLIDELHLAVAPVLLGRGESLFAGMDMAVLGYKVLKTEAGEAATHVTIGR